MLVKRWMAAAAALGVLLAAGGAAAQEAAKVAVVDMQRALNESKAGKKAVDDLDRLMESRRPDLQRQKDAIQKKRDELDKASMIMADDARRAKETELRTLERDLSRAVSDFQEEIKRRQAELSDSVQKDLVRLVERLGKEKGLTLVLVRQPGLVLYALPSIDLTDEVIKRYDAEGAR